MQLLDIKVSFTPIAVSFVLAFALASVVACGGGPEPKMVASSSNDGVPANSASEERLKGETKKPAPPPPEDPTQPYTTPMTGENGSATGTNGATGGAAGKGGAGKGGKDPAGKGGVKDPKDPTTGTAASAATKGATGKVSKAECKQLFDRYIDVAMANDPRFQGIPPEMISTLKEQALSQAQSQKGDPCSGKDVTRAQYNCAIASSSTAGWERCMK